ncbi:unnamed protein product, partial [Tetraodon nigroviridis]
VNKHKPWIETSYHGVITENTEVVLLDPPLVALDKDAPIPYAGMTRRRTRIYQRIQGAKRSCRFRLPINPGKLSCEHLKLKLASCTTTWQLFSLTGIFPFISFNLITLSASA